MRGVQPEDGVESQRALLPRCLKCHLLGFNSGDGCVFAESIAEGDDVGCVRSGGEEKRFRCGVCVSGNERAGEMIRFFRTWWCPPKWTEEVVINDRLVVGLGIVCAFGAVFPVPGTGEGVSEGLKREKSVASARPLAIARTDTSAKCIRFLMDTCTSYKKGFRPVLRKHTGGKLAGYTALELHVQYVLPQTLHDN